MELKVIGVIGAGVMGAGVAHNLVESGFEVILIDISKTILDEARKHIKQDLRLQKLLKNRKEGVSPNALLEKITFSEDWGLLESANFIIENATEKWDIKQKIYRQLDSICPAESIFAANTSVIPIGRIASATKRAHQVIGIHFMNPVPMKKMVEIIRGYHTSDQTVEATKTLLSGMGKEWVIVNDSPGFVSNRVLMLMINEAIFLAQDQVATPEEIDKIFRECFGHKMGPLETADLIGLDTILFSIEALYESFGDSKYRPCPLLKRMVDAGLMGRKSGKGFYAYGPQ